jgi:hypothetical protein
MVPCSGEHIHHPRSLRCGQLYSIRIHRHSHWPTRVNGVIAISQRLAELRGLRRSVTPDACRISLMQAEGKSFPSGKCISRLWFSRNAIGRPTLKSFPYPSVGQRWLLGPVWLWTCSFEECPPVRVLHRPYFPPYRRIENDKEKPTRKKDHSQYEASKYWPDQSRSNQA